MEPTNVTYEICQHYIKDQVDVNSALVAKVGGYHRSRNLAELASCTRHFDWAYHSINEWRFLRQIEAFFKKNSIFSQREVCSTAARNAFIAAERQCIETNFRLDYFYVKRHLLDADLNSKLSKMERYISGVLGDFRSFIEDFPSLVRVTPGATAHTPRRKSLPQLKLKTKLHCTSAATPYLRSLFHYYGFDFPQLVEVTSNRVELVPKSWKTDRTIACEPEGNLPLQLAFDTYAKRRLRRVGINLSDQTANQNAAKEASITGDFVTVDFKAASDTISFNSVAWVFPFDWFKFLCSVRTPSYRGAFGRGTYAKFSSMGNGATFAVETLMFAAACRACGSKNFLVYGDDVIIERRFYDDFIRLTRFLGFTINTDKTFTDGPFRESCGLDAWNGTDVTPVYIRGIDKRKASQCHLVNSLAPLAFPDGHLAKYLVEFVRLNRLPLVPYQESTLSGVWILPDKARNLGLLRQKSYYDKRLKKRVSSQIDRFKSFSAKSKTRRFPMRGYYLWFLNKNSQVLFNGPWELHASVTQEETSSVPIFDHKYVRKWVVWIKPHKAMPLHLYWWSDVITSPRSKQTSGG